MYVTLTYYSYSLYWNIPRSDTILFIYISSFELKKNASFPSVSVVSMLSWDKFYYELFEDLGSDSRLSRIHSNALLTIIMNFQSEWNPLIEKNTYPDSR